MGPVSLVNGPIFDAIDAGHYPHYSDTTGRKELNPHQLTCRADRSHWPCLVIQTARAVAARNREHLQLAHATRPAAPLFLPPSR